MMDRYKVYVDDPEAFKGLELEEQLEVVADIAFYCANMKNDYLEQAGKTRVDACLPAARWYDQEKYWLNIQTNIRRLAELEGLKLRRGL